MFDIQVYGAGGESPDQAEQEAIRKFEVRVNNLLHTGTNRARVIAWLMNATEKTMDQAQFDHQQPIEEIRMDEANRELRELAEAQAEQEADQAYGEYIEAMLHAFYEECFPGTEWDL